MDKTPDKDVIMKLSALLPPPASSVQLVHCARCGAKNRAPRQYCGKCGNQLWEPCVSCGQSNAAEEEFCGGCGTDLKAELARIADRIDKDVAQARLLISEYRYADALGLLKAITGAKHTRLAPATARAKGLYEQCLDHQRELMPRIRKLEEEIREHVASGEIDKAAVKADQIPEAHRSQELCDLIKQSLGQQAEIAELEQTIAQLKDGSLTQELVTKIARLLILEPDHAEARRQAVLINRGAMRKAKRIAAAGDFEKSLAILDQVPRTFRDEEFGSFRGQIADLNYFAWDVRHAPRLDETLFEFAARLETNVAENDELRRLCSDLGTRKTNFRSGALGRRDWSAAPRETNLPARLEFLDGLGRIRLAPAADCSALAENPGRFAAACGLALHGLDRAALPINLLPEKSIIGKLNRWLPKRRAQSAWGVEISSSGVKAVKLACGDGMDSPLLQECRLFEHRRLLAQSSNEQDRSLLVDETLRTFLDRCRPDNSKIVLGLPDWMVLVKTVELPPMPLAKREAAICHQARHLFSKPLPDVMWKHAVFESPQGDQPQRPATVVYAGVRRSLLEQFLTRWRRLGLKVDAVQCDLLALYNFAAFQHANTFASSHSDANNDRRPLAIVDLGSDRLNVLVCSPTRFRLRSVMLGSDRMNKTLVCELKLTHSQADKWKRNPALAPSPGRLYETVQPVYDDYVQETIDALAAFQNAFPGEEIAKIIACGGGFAAHDLPRYFLWRR